MYTIFTSAFKFQLDSGLTYFPQGNYPLRGKMTSFWSTEVEELCKSYLINQVFYWEYISSTEETEWNSKLLIRFFFSGTSHISSQNKHISTLKGGCKLLW